MNTAPEKIYIAELISEVVNLTTEPDAHKPILPTLPETSDKPEKEEHIKRSYTRFRS